MTTVVAGAVEYDGCTSAEEETLPPNESTLSVSDNL